MDAWKKWYPSDAITELCSNAILSGIKCPADLLSEENINSEIVSDMIIALLSEPGGGIRFLNDAVADEPIVVLDHENLRNALAYEMQFWIVDEWKIAENQCRSTQGVSA